MKAKSTAIALAIVMIAGLTLVMAQEGDQAGEKRNLFKTAGEKQTNKDFEPAPDKIETSFGHIGV